MKIILNSYDKNTKRAVILSFIYFNLTCIFHYIKTHSKKSLLVGMIISLCIISIFLLGFIHDYFKIFKCDHIVIRIKKDTTLDSLISTYYLHEKVYYHYATSSKAIYRKKRVNLNTYIIKTYIAKVNSLSSFKLQKNISLRIPLL